MVCFSRVGNGVVSISCIFIQLLCLYQVVLQKICCRLARFSANSMIFMRFKYFGATFEDMPLATQDYEKAAEVFNTAPNFHPRQCACQVCG
jgi:hypothetical protein